MAEEPVIIVGLATYNEMENLRSLVDTIHEQLPAARVLVVDDNSPDGTGKWCQRKSNDTSWFSCILREGKLGLGSALALLMRTAMAENADCLITMDADWSHPPERLTNLIDSSKNADVVVGSRYCPGGRITGWPWHRRIASRLMNAATRLVTGLPVRDCSGNYRLYKTSALSQLDWGKLNASGYAFIEEVLWELQQTGARFSEVPILFTNRTAGKSKISWNEMFGAFSMLIRLAGRRLGGLFSRK